MIRECTDLDGNSWSEDCVLWEDGRKFSFNVDTKGFHLRISKFQGTWGIEDGENESEHLLTVQFDYEVAPEARDQITDEMMEGHFSQSTPLILDNWITKIEAVKLTQAPTG